MVGSSRSGEGDAATPWLVPQRQRLELLFFRKVFLKLRECAMQKENREEREEGDVPLLLFQRTMSRLFLFLREDREFHSKEYDMNGDGLVSWWEFCLVWKQEELTAELSFAERVHLTLEDPQASKLGRLTSIFILLAIALSAGGFIISTLPEMQYQCCATCAPKPKRIFEKIDTACVIIFTIEYVVRLLTASCMRTALLNQEDLVRDICTDEAILWPTKMQRAWSYMRQWANLIDLMAILPSYIDFIPTGDDCPEMSGGGNGTWAREILPIIRLMRVVRAFRLGKRLEAIIIIARSMQRSLRAVWVLILNVFLGVVIFGAIIFFLEQGTYCPRFGAYLRFSGTWSLDDGLTTRADHEASSCLNLEHDGDYREDWERSPFESIPHSFWWALVTATTVGFGDDVPASKWGKIIAAVAMVWSLCVLALPVGVIGDNFGHVWDEYDAEKVIEQELHDKETQMARDAVVNIDPLVWSRVLRIEVYHNSFMATIDNDVFLGEVECELQLDAGSPVSKQLKLPLRPNVAKSDRCVSGNIFVSYTWTPKESRELDVLLQGKFDLTVERVEGLVPVDWKSNGLCDAYVRVTTFPKSPDTAGMLHPEVITTVTRMDDENPVWDTTYQLDFYWHQSGITAKVGENRRLLKESLQKDRRKDRSRIRDTVEANAELVEVLPRLEADVAEVQRSMLQMQSDVVQVRDLTREIGECLNLNQELAVRAPYRSRNRPSFIMSHSNSAVAHSGPSPCSHKIAEEAAERLYQYATARTAGQDQQWLLDTAVEDDKANSFMMPGAIADMEQEETRPASKAEKPRSNAN